MTKKLFAAILILMMCFLCGCKRIAEPNDLLYAVAVGVDKSEKNEKNGYSFTIQYAKVFEINSGAESGESGGEIVENITVEAPTLYSAVDVANHLVSKRFVLSHLSIIVFSEETAREGIGEFIELINRGREIRPDVYIAVAEGRSEDYLKNIKPSSEVNPAKYYQLMYDNVYSEYIPNTTSEDAYKSISGGGRDIAAALAGEPAENGGEIIQNGYEYGLVRMDAENTAAGGVMGMGVFSGDKLKILCTSDEVKLYNMLTDKFEYGYITFYNKKDPSMPVTLRVEKNRDTDYRVRAESDGIKVKAEVHLEAELSGLPQNYYGEKYIDEYEEEINGYLKEAAEKFLNRVYEEKCDILGIKEYVKRGFFTRDGYDRYNAEEKPVEFDIDADIEIRRVGFTARK